MVNKIKESNITDGAVTSDKIAPGTINADRLAGSIGNDKLTNSSITINGTSISLGASGDISAGTDWQSVITADGSTATTAVAGEGYFINTTSAAHTINLPASPTQGDEVTIVDYAGTFGTNNVTVGRNGSNIDGSAADGTLATNRLNVRFVYIDSTQGWRAIFDDASTNYGTLYVTATGGTVTTSGDYKIHVFTGDGCFVVSCGGNPNGSASVDYLVVAGGAGGAGCGPGGGGGGGAGGFRFSACTYSTPTAGNGSALPVSSTTYPITVGSGGAKGTNAQGSPGNNSIFSTITSTGGGGGGRGNSACVPSAAGLSGGSGGGGGTRTNCGSEFPPGGAGNTPPVSPPQGNNGGNGSHVSGHFQGGGGGGGAGAAGTDVSGSTSPTSPSGIGGAGKGLPASIATGGAGESGPGCLQYFSGGGGGGIDKPTSAPGNTVLTPIPATGGVGGGGNGGTLDPGGINATAGSANTGGGGGGGTEPGQGASAAGGSGIVIIRYKYQN